MTPLDAERLPDGLLERFIGADALSRMSALLRFLTALTVRARGVQTAT